MRTLCPKNAFASNFEDVLLYAESRSLASKTFHLQKVNQSANFSQLSKLQIMQMLPSMSWSATLRIYHKFTTYPFSTLYIPPRPAKWPWPWPNLRVWHYNCNASFPICLWLMLQTRKQYSTSCVIVNITRGRCQENKIS